MKKIYYVLIGLGIVIISAISYILMLPAEYVVSNSVYINKPVDEVFKSVSDYKQWEAWSPWMEQEPTAKHSYEGTAGTIGHKMSWEGDPNNKKGIGQGSLTITEVETNKDFEGHLAFLKPFEAEATDRWDFADSAGVTKVTWTNRGPTKGIMMKAMRGMLMDNLDASQKKGLAKMKTVLEAAPSPAPMASDTSGIMPGDSVKPM